jgi:hypothetical protein
VSAAEKISGLEELNSRLRTEHAQISVEIETRNSELSLQRGDNRLLSAALERAKSSEADLLARMQRAQDGIIALRSKLVEQDRDLKTARSDYKMAEMQRRQTKKTNENLETRIAKLLRELADTEDKLMRAEKASKPGIAANDQKGDARPVVAREQAARMARVAASADLQAAPVQQPAQQAASATRPKPAKTAASRLIENDRATAIRRKANALRAALATENTSDEAKAALAAPLMEIAAAVVADALADALADAKSGEKADEKAGSPIGQKFEAAALSGSALGAIIKAEVEAHRH